MPDSPSAGGSATAMAFPSVPVGRSDDDLVQFWADYQPIVARAAKGRLRRLNIPESLASADDVTQEVYLNVAERWPAVEHPGKYTLGCALRTVIRQVHRERLRRLGLLIDDGQEHLGEVAAAESSPEDVVLDEIVDAQLQEALPEAWEDLSEREQAAVQLTVLESASRAEAAGAMGVATGTVSSHRTRGLVKLRTALGASVGLATFAATAWASGPISGVAMVVLTGLMLFSVGCALVLKRGSGSLRLPVGPITAVIIHITLKLGLVTLILVLTTVH